MDVCGIFTMEFEGLRLNMRCLQNEADDLIKRIECVYSTTPYDHVKEFASKLYKLCNTVKYMAERLREMHHYGPEACGHFVHRRESLNVKMHVWSHGNGIPQHCTIP